jgi:hypothetical protein
MCTEFVSLGAAIYSPPWILPDSGWTARIPLGVQAESYQVQAESYQSLSRVLPSLSRVLPKSEQSPTKVQPKSEQSLTKVQAESYPVWGETVQPKSNQSLSGVLPSLSGVWPKSKWSLSEVLSSPSRILPKSNQSPTKVLVGVLLSPSQVQVESEWRPHWEGNPLSKPIDLPSRGVHIDHVQCVSWCCKES